MSYIQNAFHSGRKLLLMERVLPGAKYAFWEKKILPWAEGTFDLKTHIFLHFDSELQIDASYVLNTALNIGLSNKEWLTYWATIFTTQISLWHFFLKFS